MGLASSMCLRAVAIVVIPAALSSSVDAQTKRFGEMHRMLSSGRGTVAAFGDFDGDGDPDALIGSGGGEARIHFNDGSGSFIEAAVPLPPAPSGECAVAIGDVDGDGDLDALLVSGRTYSTPGVPDRLYLNDGSGGFTDASAQLPSVLDVTAAIALGDVDGDGDLDALLGNSEPSGTVFPVRDRLYLNDGSGVFTDATGQLPPFLDFTSDVALGDVDGDGDLDALMGNRNALSFVTGVLNRLYLNDGSGRFTDATAQLPPIPGYTFALDLGDADGDGDLDAVFAGGDFGGLRPLRLLLNGGAGVFADASVLLPAVSEPLYAVSFGDVDGDGDLDLVAGGSLADHLLRNGGPAGFTDASAQLPAVVDKTTAIAFADVDADGDQDALITNLGDKDLYLNDGQGSFASAFGDLPPHRERARAVAVGDVDGDGDEDALVASMSAERLYENDGRGVFTDATAQLPAPAYGAAALVLGDVDGDGDLDVLIGDTDRLQLNDGSGNFVDAPPQLSYTCVFSSVALGDIDGDLDADAIVTGFALCGSFSCSGAPRYIYVNDGSGAFAMALNPFPGTSATGYTSAVALEDLDGDGDRDAFFAEFGNPAYLYTGPGGQSGLWLNDGTGSFTDATAQLPANPLWTSAVALGDVDGDGDRDALIGSRLEGTRLFLNDGAAVFTDASAQVPSLKNETRTVALADVDADGDLDAVIGNDGADQLFRNDGTGVFTDATDELPSVAAGSWALALADLDGDGDLDLLTGSLSGNKALANLTRQIAWRGIPRVGKPLTLDFYGPSSGGWILGFSLGSASVPIAPFGTLRLDPATLSFVGFGLLNPQGTAAVTYAVPAIPSLAGIPVYWQALVAPPLVFTNLEVTTLTNL